MQNALKARPISMEFSQCAAGPADFRPAGGVVSSLPFLWRAFPRPKGSSSNRCPEALGAVSRRVESAALRLVVQRAEGHSGSPAHALHRGRILVGAASLLGRLVKPTFTQLAEARDTLSTLVSRQLPLPTSLKKESLEHPPAPFTTSTLAGGSAQLGFSIRRTMATAQALYEKGHITYMRTDSRTWPEPSKSFTR